MEVNGIQFRRVNLFVAPDHCRESGSLISVKFVLLRHAARIASLRAQGTGSETIAAQLRVGASSGSAATSDSVNCSASDPGVGTGVFNG